HKILITYLEKKIELYNSAIQDALNDADDVMADGLAADSMDMAEMAAAMFYGKGDFEDPWAKDISESHPELVIDFFEQYIYQQLSEYGSLSVDKLIQQAENHAFWTNVGYMGHEE